MLIPASSAKGRDDQSPSRAHLEAQLQTVQSPSDDYTTLVKRAGSMSWLRSWLLSCLRMVGISIGDYLLFSFAVKHCCGHSLLSIVSENHVVISKLLRVWWIMFLQRVVLSSSMRDWAIPRYLGRPCKWSDSLVYWVWIRFQNDKENPIELLDSSKCSQLCGPWLGRLLPVLMTSHKYKPRTRNVDVYPAVCLSVLHLWLRTIFCWSHVLFSLWNK